MNMIMIIYTILYVVTLTYQQLGVRHCVHRILLWTALLPHKDCLPEEDRSRVLYVSRCS